MKTITIKFRNSEGDLGWVRGEFSTLPGRGNLVWHDKEKIEAALVPPFSRPLPDDHYAESFQSAMEGMAKRHGWLPPEIDCVGDWRVFPE